MKLGVNADIFPREIGFDEMIRLTGDLGYTGIEFNVQAYDVLPRLWDKRRRRDLLALARENGVEFPSICMNTHRTWSFADPDPHIREAGVSLLNEIIDLAVDLEAGIVLLCAWDGEGLEPENSWELFKASLSQSIPVAEQKGITLALEAVGCDFLLTSADLMRMISEIADTLRPGVDRLGIYLDVGNAASIGLPVVEEIRVAGERACQMHFKDTEAQFFSQTVPLGEGIVDFEEAVRALEEIGFDGDVLVEVPAAPDDPIRIARESKAFLDALFGS
jgi:sugar phosphate isomerase/epimerase